MTTRASPRHLRLVPSPARRDVAEREFPVHFTRPPYRLGWLRRPANGFGWVGTGTLRFESEGVLLSGKRLTLLGLRRARRLILPEEIRDVYREGNAVQINLHVGARRPFLRFWARDAAEATRLVARLPTRRTIELETELRSPEAAGRARRSALLLLALAVAVLVGLSWLRAVRLGPAPAPLSAPSWRTEHAAAASAGDLERAVRGASDAEVQQSRADLERFGERFAGLTTQFTTAFNALMLGNLSQQAFADGAEQWLLPQWRTLAQQLPSAPAETLRGRSAQELGAVVAGWQRALTLYAHGLRARDPAEVNGAFDAMRDAEAHQQRAWRLRGDLEHRQSESAVSEQAASGVPGHAAQ